MRTEVFKPVFTRQLPETREMEQGKLYISLQYKTSKHLCACGCGQLTVLPFDKTGWTLSQVEQELSFNPSILNRSCGAHYYIHSNKTIWI